MSDNLNPHPHEEGAFDQLWWLSRGSLGKAVLVVVIGILALYLLRPLFQPASSLQSPATPSSILGDVALAPAAQITSTYYFSWAAQDQASDIYSTDTTLTNSQPVQLTNTPYLSELWPMPSPAGARLAFFVVTPQDERSLRVLDASQQNIDVTYNISGTDLIKKYQIDLNSPPFWSPDGKWLAFLGSSTNKDQPSVELFVAEVDTSTVYRLTDLDSVVVSPRWIDETTLVFAQEVNDHTLALFRIPATLRLHKVEPESLGSIRK